MHTVDVTVTVDKTVDRARMTHRILGRGEKKWGSLAVVRHPVEVVTKFRTPKGSSNIWGIDNHVRRTIINSPSVIFFQSAAVRIDSNKANEYDTSPHS